MRYFNGFSLKGEESLFQDYLIDNDFTTVGFSYGAIRAFEEIYNSKTRVDRLILLSPAFFQNHKKSFMRTQLRYFKLDRDSYIKEFLKNIAYPLDIDLSLYLSNGTIEELNHLLSYRWSQDRILEVIKRGVTIEVFIGGMDKIIDSSKAFDFFSKITTTYLLKDKGHILL